MRRIANGTQVAVMPARPAPSGTPGYGRNGNPSLGEEATIFDADTYNMGQEELAKAIEGLGITLDDTGADDAQLLKAILRAFGSVATLTTNTTLTAAHAGLVLLSAAGGNRSFGLSAANAAGAKPIRQVLARADTATGNTLTLTPAGADTVNGLTSGITLPPGAIVTLLSDGASAWRLIASVGLEMAQAITATGNATVPWWSRACDVECVGGGGGGGYQGTWATGGGGSGGRAIKRITGLTPGSAIPCTIGAGGTAPASSPPQNGGTGGTTSFGAHCSATGGQGGTGTVAGNNAGGGPGTGSGGDINLAGAFGGDSIPQGLRGGDGGGPGNGRGATGFSSGIAAQGYGGGGGGGGSSAAGGGGGGASGGTGFQGVIFVRWLP